MNKFKVKQNMSWLFFLDIKASLLLNKITHQKLSEINLEGGNV